MRVFHCDHCQNLLFFENIKCLNCDHALAFVPDAMDVRALQPINNQLWQLPGSKSDGPKYRLCENYTTHNVCNWAVDANDPEPLCVSCRLTNIIPNLDNENYKQAWYSLEQAKRRLIYSLLALNLPLSSKTEDPDRGVEFDFKADDPSDPNSIVLTGHANGVITINIAEADDAERERRRVDLREPYRTVLGHFRHESGHYYWDRLIADGPRLDRFRELFGDEQVDYGAALNNHYQQGPPGDWQSRFVSAYATSHPWEDWAETWGHYLHMIDTIEMARTAGFALLPGRGDEPRVHPAKVHSNAKLAPFDGMMDYWNATTYFLNNLNRGLGQKDGYPFILSTPVVEKIRFVHQACLQETMFNESAPAIAMVAAVPS